MKWNLDLGGSLVQHQQHVLCKISGLMYADIILTVIYSISWLVLLNNGSRHQHMHDFM